MVDEATLGHECTDLVFAEGRRNSGEGGAGGGGFSQSGLCECGGDLGDCGQSVAGSCCGAGGFWGEVEWGFGEGWIYFATDRGETCGGGVSVTWGACGSV